MKKILLTGFSVLVAFAVSAQCPVGETEVTMSVSTDAYGSETEWEVTGVGGSPVFASGGPYQDQSTAGSFAQTPVSFCVPDGTVIEVTVTDEYGDGMCCSYGDGSWAISVGGTDLLTGGSFGESETGRAVIGGVDLAMNEITVSHVLVSGSTPITATVKNLGTETVSGFTLAYTLDNGAPEQQSFTDVVAVGETVAVTFTTPWNATPGSYTLAMELSGVSGDAIPDNNSLSKDVTVATQIGTRLPLIEQFTSSTCNPCYSFNYNGYLGNGFTAGLEAMNANDQNNAEVAVVKYQYDFPGMGDHAYNAEVATRVFGFYFQGSIGIPEVLIDAKLYNAFALTPADIVNHQDQPAVIDISATHTITNGNEITVDVTVDPYIDLDAKLHIYLLEKHYSATNHASFSNGETDFYHVFRKMLPSPSGTSLSLTADTPFSTQQSYTATINSSLPAQGSHDFHAGSALEVIAFVQGSDKTIYNAAISAGNDQLTGLTDYDDNTAIGVYPNPATTDQLHVVLETEGAADAILTITDLKGAVVLTQPIGKLIAGTNKHTVAIGALKSGVYNVNIMTNGHMHSARVVVQK